jgi:hypothetical protein
MAIEFVSFPFKNGGYFHSYVAVYQRVTINFWSILYPVFLYAILWQPQICNLYIIMKSHPPYKENPDFRQGKHGIL